MQAAVSAMPKSYNGVFISRRYVLFTMALYDPLQVVERTAVV